MPLIRNFLVVGAGTLVSRVSGFLRDVLIAAVLGAGGVAEAYVAAFLLPNLFRRTMGEGALNTAYVPIAARRRAEGGEAAFAAAALGGLVLFALSLLALAELFMPALIGLVAPGFAAGSQKVIDAVLYGRIAFVSVGCIVVTALFSAHLNGQGRFAAASFASFIMNAMLIAALVVLLLAGSEARGAGLVLAITIALAGIMHLLVVAGAASRAGAPLLPSSPFGDRDVRRMLVLALPAMALAGAGHLNMLVGAVLSSTISSAVAWLYYADRLFQLPLGFVSAAVGVVLLPSMARALQEGDIWGARHALFRALEFGLLLALPAAIALFLLAEPIADIVYRRAAFSPADSRAVADMLRVLAFGMPGFVLVSVFMPPYAVRESLRLPLLAVAVGLAVNLVATLVLQPRLGAAAAPVGIVAAAWTNALILGTGLVASGRLHPDETARRRLPALLLAAAGTGAVVTILHTLLATWLEAGEPLLIRATALLLICGVGLCAHGLLAFALRIVDRAALRSMFGERAGS